VTKRKDARRAEEAKQAAREQEILRKAGTLEPRPAPRPQTSPSPAPVPGAGTAVPPGTAAPGGQKKTRTAASWQPVPSRESRLRATQQAFAAALAAALAVRTAWDEPPALYTVHHALGACRLHPLRLPPGASWSDGRPHEVILATALALSSAPPAPVPPGFVGVAVRHEAWTLRDEDMTPGQRQRAVAGNPDRPSLASNYVEARVFQGLDTVGVGYQVHQLRNGKQQTFTCPPGTGTALLGQVPDALRALPAAMTSHQPRQENPGRPAPVTMLTAGSGRREAGSRSNGDIVPFIGWNQRFIVAAITDDGTTLLQGAPTLEAAEELADKLPGQQVSILRGTAAGVDAQELADKLVGLAVSSDEVGSGPTVVRAKVLSAVEAVMARREFGSPEQTAGRARGEHPTLN
jgi:hypothetical protein